MPETYPLLTVSTPLGDDAFILTGVAGREELSRPFAFTLDLVAEVGVVTAPADLVGKPVGWTVNYPTTAVRQFHGVVRSLVAGEYLVGRSRRVYRAEVVPWLWFLTRTADCKIFQNKTAPQIVEDVFKAFGFTGESYRLSLTGTYPVREYCVQYRETAFNFVSRLLEEEGIFYFFEYAAGKHTLVLADATSAYADCDPHAEPEYRPDLAEAPVVLSIERRHEYRSGKYTHTDYNFETPSTNLKKTVSTTVPIPGNKAYEVFDFPGLYPDGAVGGDRVKVRIEEVEAGYDTANGTGRCNSFRPAGKFTLQKHAAETDPFVLVAVEHTASEPLSGGVRGGGGDYRNSFTAVPAAVPFRPDRLTRKPVVEGPQTAVIVGPAGEEIYTDKYGRVKVHFHWDRYGAKDDKDTCWIRVGELWAGKNWGMIFTPRIGQEVVVDFLEGDPDRPIVTGRVYNAEQMPPYDLPANMTQSGIKSRSTKNGTAEHFNELRFEDKRDSEEIYFHAQKNFVRFVEYDDTLTVGHDQTIEIKNNRKLTVLEGWEKIFIDKGDRERTVTKGNDALTVSTGKRTVDVKADYAVTVQDGNRTITVNTGNDTHQVKTGNREVKVDTGNDTTTVAAGDMTIEVTAGKALIKAGTSITLQVGGNTIVLDTSSLKITVGGSTMEFTSATIAAKTTTLTMEGSAQAKMSGAMAEVNGSGMAKVVGGVVMIN